MSKTTYPLKLPASIKAAAARRAIDRPSPPPRAMRPMPPNRPPLRRPRHVRPMPPLIRATTASPTAATATITAASA